MADSNMNTRGNGLTYADAGVSIDAGNALVEAIKPLAKSTARSGANSELGGFGGLFDLKAAGFNDPLLVAANDGVGTKLKIAFETDRHDTVGIDLVAMCVNDLVVQGAEPLFFLDYFATGKLSHEQGVAVVAGIAEGCRQAGAALIGGETAEMPGMYNDGEYDLAGFCVGAVERGKVLPRNDMCEGDVLIGLASDGAHSNGFSLIRKIVERSGLDYTADCPFEPGITLGEVLLRPTRIYVASLLDVVAEFQRDQRHGAYYGWRIDRKHSPHAARRPWCPGQSGCSYATKCICLACKDRGHRRCRHAADFQLWHRHGGWLSAAKRPHGWSTISTPMASVAPSSARSCPAVIRRVSISWAIWICSYGQQKASWHSDFRARQQHGVPDRCMFAS